MSTKPSRGGDDFLEVPHRELGHGGQIAPVCPWRARDYGRHPPNGWTSPLQCGLLTTENAICCRQGTTRRCCADAWRQQSEVGRRLTAEVPKLVQETAYRLSVVISLRQ